VPSSWSKYGRDCEQPELRSEPGTPLKDDSILGPTTASSQAAEHLEVPAGQPSPRANAGGVIDLDTPPLAVAPTCNVSMDKLAEQISNGDVDFANIERSLTSAVKQKNEDRATAFMQSLTENEKKLQTQAATSEMDLRSSVGQLFSRGVGKGSEYKDLKSQTEKRCFRATWLSAEWNKVVCRKEYSKAFNKIDESRGSYMCFEKICEEEGGNLRAAALYVSKCARMGSPWSLWNPMTERVDWLYIRKSMIETFVEAWTFYEQEEPDRTTTSSPPAAIVASAAQAAIAASAAPAIAASSSSGSGGPAGNGLPPVDEPPAKKPRTSATAAAAANGTAANSGNGKAGKANETVPKVATPEKARQANVSQLLCQASKVKVKYLGISGAAATLLQTIKSDEKWRWANNDFVQSSLVVAFDSMRNLETDFSRMFLNADVKAVRKVYCEAALIQNLKDFATTFASAVAKVELETQQLVQMQSARKR
jgi:hypothetical protein